MTSVALKLLPHSLKFDPFTVAMVEALEIQMLQLREEFEEVADLIRITTQNEQLIDFIAFEKHVDFYQGLSTEEKRNVVKGALRIHAKKGTKYALQQIFEMLFLKGDVREWFEYGGDPYYFKVEILEVSNKGISDELLSLLDMLIATYKNNRSWIEVLNVYLTSKGNKLYFGAYTLTGEEITVYPYASKDLITHAVIKSGAAHGNDVEHVTVYPEGGTQSE